MTESPTGCGLICARVLSAVAPLCPVDFCLEQTVKTGVDIPYREEYD